MENTGKRKRRFILFDANDQQLGFGDAYDEGNVQCYMKPHYTALQMQLADVLSIEGVVKFEWVGTAVPRGEPSANEIWNRLDGAYNPKEFD